LGETVDLYIRIKGNWTEEQIAQAYAKAEALTKAETVVTKKMVQRESNLRTKFKKAGGQVNDKEQVDHIVDLQLGGKNRMENLWSLDASVNMSFGAQINQQIRKLQDGTVVNRVIVLPLKKL
jgi:hypothetical protein